MEKEIIFERARNLPRILGGNIAEDWQIWEENQAGAHFKLTKEILPIPNGPTIYMLSVSGRREGVDSVFDDFQGAIGVPVRRFQDHNMPGIHFAFWLADDVDKILDK